MSFSQFHELMKDSKKKNFSKEIVWFFSLAVLAALLFREGFFYVFSLIYLSLKFKEKSKLIILVFWFVVGVLPVLPFPKHHLAIEQTLSLIGLSFLVGIIFSQGYLNKGLVRFLSIIGLISCLIIVFNNVNLAGKTHYSATGSRLVWMSVTYLKSIYEGISENTIFYFKDRKILIPQYGSSKQISLAFGGREGF